MTDFEVDETVVIELDVRDTDTNAFTNPDSGWPKIKIEKDDEVLQNFTEMTQSSEGNFYFDYVPSSTGRYKTIFKAEKSGRTTIKKDFFFVEET